MAVRSVVFMIHKIVQIIYFRVSFCVFDLQSCSVYFQYTANVASMFGNWVNKVVKCKQTKAQISVLGHVLCFWLY
jgi:hypothetical protein